MHELGNAMHQGVSRPTPSVLIGQSMCLHGPGKLKVKNTFIDGCESDEFESGDSGDKSMQRRARSCPILPGDSEAPEAPPGFGMHRYIYAQMLENKTNMQMYPLARGPA